MQRRVQLDGDLPQACIGEAENLPDRLKQHLVGKDFWTESVAFVSKDNNRNKAHVKYLAHRLYRLAQRAGRCALINGNIPSVPSVPERDREEMEEQGKVGERNRRVPFPYPLRPAKSCPQLIFRFPKKLWPLAKFCL